MFDILQPKFGGDKTEQVVQAEELEKLGSIMLQPGHRLFQVNTETMEITEAIPLEDLKKQNKYVKTDPSGRIVYVPALNKKNALKRIKRAMNV